MPCCAHCKVVLNPKQHPNKTLSDYWECKDCGLQFFPKPYSDRVKAERDQLRAEVERLKKGWDQCNEIANKYEVQRNDALMRLGEIQAAVSEMFDLNHTATTADEICKVIDRAIHKYSSQRDSALAQRDQWREVAELYHKACCVDSDATFDTAEVAYERLAKGETK